MLGTIPKARHVFSKAAYFAKQCLGNDLLLYTSRSLDAKLIYPA